MGNKEPKLLELQGYGQWMNSDTWNESYDSALQTSDEETWKYNLEIYWFISLPLDIL